MLPVVAMGTAVVAIAVVEVAAIALVAVAVMALEAEVPPSPNPQCRHPAVHAVTEEDPNAHTNSTLTP